jgi:hypothetical protein
MLVQLYLDFDYPACNSAIQVALLGPPPAHLGGGLAGLVVLGEERLRQIRDERGYWSRALT